jgi:uncharacterized protein YbjT (DUF2867 family)
VAGDVLRPESVRAGLAGVDAAFYLVHSMGSRRSWDDADRRAAVEFGAAAREAGVGRIVYLGGLGEGELSEHLTSRQEVGRLLRESGVPTVELRASVVIGSGSASFEILRALVDRLPLMLTPRWVSTRAQPIAIEDVLAYLLEALDLPLGAGESRVYEIGGADVVSYRGLMEEYARQRGLRRLVLPVPVLTPWLSSLWLGLVTPVYAGIGRKLIDGLRNETIVRDDAALRDFAVRPRGAREAVARALVNEDLEAPQSRWSDEVSPPVPYGGVRLGSRLVDTRARRVPVPPADAFAPIQRIGGRTGWYSPLLLWRLRGLVDLAVGGPGLRRGRRDPVSVRVGEPIDFWRVEALRAGAAPAARGRDEAAGTRLARVRGRAGRRRRQRDPADGVVRPRRPRGACVLVRALALPRPDLRPDAARDRRRVEVVTQLTRTRAPGGATVGAWTRRARCWSGWPASRRSTGRRRLPASCSASCACSSGRRRTGPGRKEVTQGPTRRCDDSGPRSRMT